MIRISFVLVVVLACGCSAEVRSQEPPPENPCPGVPAAGALRMLDDRVTQIAFGRCGELAFLDSDGTLFHVGSAIGDPTPVADSVNWIGASPSAARLAFMTSIRDADSTSGTGLLEMADGTPSEVLFLPLPRRSGASGFLRGRDRGEDPFFLCGDEELLRLDSRGLHVLAEDVGGCFGLTAAAASPVVAWGDESGQLAVTDVELGETRRFERNFVSNREAQDGKHHLDQALLSPDGRVLLLQPAWEEMSGDQARVSTSDLAIVDLLDDREIASLAATPMRGDEIFYRPGAMTLPVFLGDGHAAAIPGSESLWILSPSLEVRALDDSWLLGSLGGRALAGTDFGSRPKVVVVEPFTGGTEILAEDPNYGLLASSESGAVFGATLRTLMCIHRREADGKLACHTPVGTLRLRKGGTVREIYSYDYVPIAHWIGDDGSVLVEASPAAGPIPELGRRPEVEDLERKIHLIGPAGEVRGHWKLGFGSRSVRAGPTLLVVHSYRDPQGGPLAFFDELWAIDISSGRSEFVFAGRWIVVSVDPTRDRVAILRLPIEQVSGFARDEPAELWAGATPRP